MAPETAIAARGMPDWQTVVKTEQFDLLGGYDDAGLCFAVPRAARLANLADGTPDLLLEFVADRNTPNPDDYLYAMLAMGLEIDADLATAHAALQAAGNNAALLPCTFTTGCYLHLELGDTRFSAPFAWQDAGHTTINARLEPGAATLFYGALGNGSPAVASAALECELAAILPRLDLDLRFDPAAVVAALRQALDPDGSGVPFRALVNRLSDPPAGLFSFSAPTGGASPALGLALAARLRAAFGSYLPCQRIANGPSIRLDVPTGSAEIRWDLRTPVLASVPQLLRYDPFAVVADSSLRERVTVFTGVPRFPDQLRTRQVMVASGLPDTLHNCEQVTVNLQVAAVDSESGAVTTYAHAVYPPQPKASPVALRFARTAPPQPYRYNLTVVTDDDAIEGPWRDGSENYLFIDAASLPPPLSVVTISATPALLAQAEIALAFSGMTPAGAFGQSLDQDGPRAALLLAASDTARLQVLARDKTDPGRSMALDLPCHSVALDQTAFSGYCWQRVSVTARFHGGATCARLECLPEDAGVQSIVLDFSASSPSAQLAYFAPSLFRNRYRCRPYSEQDTDAAPWSALFPPDAALTIDVGPDGMHLAATSNPSGDANP